MIGKRNSVPTEEVIEQRIRDEMAVVRKSISRHKTTRQELEILYRKYENIYKHAVLDGGSTTEAYVYKEVYRRILHGK